jgi:endonuclease-3
VSFFIDDLILKSSIVTKHCSCETFRTQTTKAKIKRISALLEREYGIPKRERNADLLDVLVQTILSQNTNDQNRDRAYRRLKSKFPRWRDILNGKREVVVEALRPGGLARQKAKRIVDILQWLRKREGKVSLTFLKRMGEEEIKETLGGLKGIGPKTVNCLLLFGLGREAFPVDTHILRVGKRLGFIPQRSMQRELIHGWGLSCPREKLCPFMSISSDMEDSCANRRTLDVPTVFSKRSVCIIINPLNPPLSNIKGDLLLSLYERRLGEIIKVRMRELLKKLLQIEDTPERTALAFSIGIFLGFSPFWDFIP